MEEWSTRGGVKVAVQVSHCLFCMGAYKCNVVIVIKMGVYIHGVLILCGCLLSRFYGVDVEPGVNINDITLPLMK